MGNKHRRSIKIWLYKNLLAKKDSYKARTLPHRTITNAELAAFIYERRPSVSLDTIEYVLSLCDEMKIELLTNGYAILDGAYHAYPSVTGSFDTLTRRYDADRHEVGVKVHPSPRLRKEMLDCEVQILGTARTGPDVMAVKDFGTQTAYDRVTPDFAFEVRGERLAIVGDSEENGVYFVSVRDATQRIKVEMLLENKPKRLLFNVPDLPDDEYRLEVVTQYSNGSRPVKKARTGQYRAVLKVQRKG